jgi:hypothetical protein
MTKKKDPKPRLAFVETPLTAEEETERMELMRELGFDTSPLAGNRNWVRQFRLLKEFRDRIAALEGRS